MDSRLTDTHTRILPQTYLLLPSKMNTPKANVILLAIGLQESRLEYQKQIGGPAHGLFQFEKGGGVRGVMTHAASKNYAVSVCKALGVEPTIEAVYQALTSTQDVLDAAMARLLLWTDSGKLPELGDEQGAWKVYLRVWGPGKPHPKTWSGFYQAAMKEVLG